MNGELAVSWKRGARQITVVGAESLALLFTFAMLEFTEILPKTLGVRFNRDIAVWVARPLQVAVLLRPLLYFIHALNRQAYRV